MKRLIWVACLALAAGAVEEVELKRFPIESLDGVITRDGVRLDKAATVDGNGSLELKARHPTTFRLFETGDVDAEEAVLIYRAKMKTRKVKGDAYLEMWCHFPGGGGDKGRPAAVSCGAARGPGTRSAPPAAASASRTGDRPAAGCSRDRRAP